MSTHDTVQSWPPARTAGLVGALVALTAFAGLMVLLVNGGPLWAAIGVLALGLLLLRRVDFPLAYLLVVSGASFVDYTQGRLTAQLALLTVALLFMLACYALERGRARFQIPRTVLTVPLIVFTVLTAANWVRGMLAGNSPRYGGLELLIGLALGSSLLIANRPFPRERLREFSTWLFVLGIGHLVLGVVFLALLGVRTGRLSFTPVPGLIAVLFLNLALRQPDRAGRVMWLLAALPMLLHQFISFTRGYWLASAVAIAFSVALYGGRGAGAADRWRRIGVGGAALAGLAIVGATMLGAVLGFGNVMEQAGMRLASSTSTEFTYEAGSNVIRLVEYVQVWEHIQRAPWFGHGLGYAFVVREPFRLQLLEQWATHNNYLLVWVKQGVLGLTLFVWMMVSAVRAGVRGRTLPDPDQAAWCAATAASAVYLLVYCLVHFPLGEINTTFTFALLLGVTMSLTSRGFAGVRWRAPATAAREAS